MAVSLNALCRHKGVFVAWAAGVLWWSPAVALDVYQLSNRIVTANAGQSAPVVNFRTDGGSIAYDVVYNSSCRGSYQMEWQFSRDVNVLADGENFAVTINCTACTDVCGFKWREGAGSLGGTNNLLSIQGVADYVYNGNFVMTEYGGEVKAWDSSTFSRQSQFEVSVRKTAPDSGFYLNLGDHQIVYHYQLAEDETVSVGADLGISVPRARLTLPDGTVQFITFELAPAGVNAQSELLWRLERVAVKP